MDRPIKQAMQAYVRVRVNLSNALSLTSPPFAFVQTRHSLTGGIERERGARKQESAIFYYN